MPLQNVDTRDQDTVTKYEYNGTQYDTQEQARQAQEANARAMYADAASVGYDENRFDMLMQSGRALSQMSDDERTYINRAFLQSDYANAKYTKSDTDAYLASVGLPPMRSLDKYREKYNAYKSSGNVSENYGHLSDSAWKKINELWSKDWKYGLSSDDTVRKSLGLAPSSYDSMYEDTALDDELKQRGLPPSKLLNGKLGEAYNEWVKNDQTRTRFMDEVARLMVKNGGKPKSAEQFFTNPQASLYSLNDAIEEAGSDPQWSEFFRAHYGNSMDIPHQDDDKYLEYDDDGNAFYNEEKFQKDFSKATKNNDALSNDEFSISKDDLQKYYNDNAAFTKADMLAERYFADNGISYDKDKRFLDERYLNVARDMFSGISVNNGDGYTLDTLFPDISFTDEQKNDIQPLIDEANRLRLEKGASAANEYLSKGGFADALKQIGNEKIVAAMRSRNTNTPGYAEKTDDEVLQQYYDDVGKEYLMNSDEIAALKNGDMTLEQYMQTKCPTREAADAFANERYDEYCRANHLPQKGEWDKAIADREKANLYVASGIGESDRTLLDKSEKEWDSIVSYWYKYAKRFKSREEAYEAGDAVDDDLQFESALEEWEYANDIVKKAMKAKDLYKKLKAMDQYIDPSKSWSMQPAVDKNARNDAYAQRIAFQADALSYTPDFAEKTADTDYVNQRFEQIIDRWADALTSSMDDAIAAYATDEDKAKVVYMFDSTGKDNPNRIVHIAAETYLNDVMMRKWDYLRRDDKRKSTSYAFGAGESDSGFVRWLGGAAQTTVLSPAAGIAEGIYNFGQDAITLLFGHRIYSSTRSTWSTDAMSDLTEHVGGSDTVGGFVLNLIPSMVQSGASMYLAAHTGGATEAFTLAAMSTEAYSSAVDAALQNGASSEQAFLYGLANGINEYLFEKISFDQFLNNTAAVKDAIIAARESGKYTTKQLAGIFAKELGKATALQGTIEASEELNTGIANLLAASVILGNKSDYNIAVKRYMENGMSESDAREKATNDMFDSLKTDFLGGLISGAIMSFGGSLLRTKGGRIIVDNTGMSGFINQTHNLSLISVNEALTIAQKSLATDANGMYTMESVSKVFDDLVSRGADASTMTRVMNELSDRSTAGALAVMQEKIGIQRRVDESKLIKAASKYVYKNVENRTDVTMGGVARITNEYLDNLSGTVQQSSLSALQLAISDMQNGYISDIKSLAGKGNVESGFKIVDDYYRNLPAETQRQIAESAKSYMPVFERAVTNGRDAGIYANVAAVMENAVKDSGALRGLSTLFGSSANVASNAIRNACLNTNGETAVRFIDAVAAATNILSNQDGSHLFRAAQMNMDPTAYVAAQMALAQTFAEADKESGRKSMSGSLYNYIVRYGATSELMDMMTAANICDSAGSFATNIRMQTGTLRTVEQLREVQSEYEKAAANYDNKQKIMESHRQADAQALAAEDGRIANYDSQIADLQTRLATNSELAKTLADRISARQSAIDARKTLVAEQAKRMTSTQADLDAAEAAFKSARTKYWNAMMDHSAQYLQRLGAEMQGIMDGQHLANSAIASASALATYGTTEDLNDVKRKMIASEKAAAVSLGKALGVDVQCVKFDKAFFDEHKIDDNKRDEEAPGCEINGTVYLNENVMEPKVGSLTNDVLLHEIGHVLENSADDYKKFADFAIRYWENKDGKDYVAFAEKEIGRDELVAEFARQVALADPRAVNALCKSAPKMSMRVFQWLTNVRNKLTTASATQTKIVRDAQRAFASGLKTIRTSSTDSENVADENRAAANDALNAMETSEKMAEIINNDETQSNPESKKNAVSAAEDFAQNSIDTNNPTEYNDNEVNANADNEAVEGRVRSALQGSDGQVQHNDGQRTESYARADSERVGVTQSEGDSDLSRNGLVGRGNRAENLRLLNDHREAFHKKDSGYFEMKETDDHKRFADALNNMRANNIEGASVDPKTVDDLNGMITLLTDDNSAGVAVAPNGNITGLFKNRKINSNKNAGIDLMFAAIASGGDRCDCYGPFLANTYANAGMVPVARVQYARGFNPEMDAYIDEMRAKGKAGFETDPDIYFMRVQPDWSFDDLVKAYESGETKQYSKEDLDALPLFEDSDGEYGYDRAEAYRDAQIKNTVWDDAKKAGYNIRAYHGTSSGGFDVFDFGKMKYGLFGTGFYFTEDPEIAQTYTKKGKGQNPEVKQVFLKAQNEIDMDATADVNAWIKSADEYDFDLRPYIDEIAAEKGGIENLTNTDCFHALKNAIADDGYVTTYDAGEITSGVIQNMGYDGITHIGGDRRGNGEHPHRVHIVFEQEQIKSADPVTHDKNTGVAIPRSERFNQDKASISYYTTYDAENFNAKEHDAEYMDLARRYESGDKSVEAELRKAVDAAAKKSGYPINGWHGSDILFNAFDKNKIRAVDYDAPFNGFWFTSDKRNAAPAMRSSNVVREFYLNIENPAPYDVWKMVDRAVRNDWNMNRDAIRDGARSINDEVRYRLQDMGYDGVHYSGPYIFTGDNVAEYNSNGSTSFYDVSGRQYDLRNDDGYARLYRHNSYDEISPYDSAEDFLEMNENEYKEEDVWVAFEPSQIKSADLVTYDSDGNIIPLSKRFDKTQDDIRYYTKYDPQALSMQKSIERMTDEEKRIAGSPRLIRTQNGAMVARLFSLEGAQLGNPAFNAGGLQNIAMIAPVNAFDGNVMRGVSMSECKAIVVPNTTEYATLRADARDANVNACVYDESDPSQFERAINRAADANSIRLYPKMTYEQLLNRYKEIKQGMEPRVENRPVPRQTTDDNKVSQTARTIAEAPVTTDKTYSDMQSWILNDTGTYTPVSNAKTLWVARGVIERADSISQAAQDLHRDVANGQGKNTDLLARAELLYVEAQNPDSGLTAAEREKIFGDLCIIAGDSGRALQLTAQLKRMTPEGHIEYIEQVGKRMADRFEKRTKKRVNLKLTEEEKDAYRRAITEDQRKEVDKKVGERFAEATSDLSFLDRVRNWRYFAMLGNPRTHFRNMVGNALMRPAARIKDFNNAWLQAAFKVDKSDRTTTPWTGRVDAQTKEFVEDELKKALPIMQGVSTKYLEEISRPTDTEEKRGTWMERKKAALTQEVPGARLSNANNKWGRFWNTLSYINSNALELEDAHALGKRFRSSMYQIIKARELNVKTMTEAQRSDIVNYAMQESLRATFRDASALADALNRLANTNRATRFVMEAIVPFKRTPINIAKRSVEYSPIGLVNGLYKLFSSNASYKAEVKRINSMTDLTEKERNTELENAKQTQKQQKIAAIDRLAEGVTGSVLTAIGFFASKMGWISIGRKDDKEASFEQALGKNTYSLNIGDLSIDLSAFSPAAVPMLMGAALEGATGADRDDGFAEAVISTLCESVDPVTEMSMLSGIADALSGTSNSSEESRNTRWIGAIAGNAVKSYVGQFVPTFVGQTARVIDPYARSYSAGDDYWASKAFGSEVGSAVKNLQNKIGLGWLSEPKIDLHGEPVRNYTNFGSFMLNMANNWFFPATIKVDMKNEIDDELVRLYGVVDSDKLFPTKPSRSLGTYTDPKTKKSEPIKLTNDEEYMLYQMEYGQTVYDMLEELMRTQKYRNMTDEEKAEAVEEKIEEAKTITRKRWKAEKTSKK